MIITKEEQLRRRILEVLAYYEEEESERKMWEEILFKDLEELLQSTYNQGLGDGMTNRKNFG